MNKSILVIDKPKSCSECQLFHDERCPIVGRVISVGAYGKRVYDKCPLQDTTELLEALEVLKKDLEWYFSLNERQESAYNKLKQALGGKQ